MYRKCKSCLVKKPLTEYYRDPRYRKGRIYHCKSCRYAKSNEWRRNNPDRSREYQRKYRRKDPERTKQIRKAWMAKNRDRQLMLRRSRRLTRLYGLSIKKYEALVEKCGGVCQICGDEPRGRFKKLHVDHDHKTGKFRGLLCVGCNRAIGYLSDSVKRAMAVVRYLKKHRHGGKKA